MDLFFYKTHTKLQNKKILDTLRNILKHNLYKKDFCLKIRDIKKDPTNPQKKYLFGIVYKHILDGLIELGNDDYKNTEDVHYFMKYQLKYYEIPEIKLKDKKKHASFKFKTISFKGNKKEVTLYIDECIRWASLNLGLDIPEPVNQGYKNYK